MILAGASNTFSINGNKILPPTKPSGMKVTLACLDGNVPAGNLFS
jgi:hypothetical protein